MPSVVRRLAAVMTVVPSLGAMACAAILGFDPYSAEPQDGGGDVHLTDAPSETGVIDAGPCDPDKEFSSTTESVRGISDLGWASVRSATLSRDELHIYFHGFVKQGAPEDIYTATRDSLTEPFKDVVPLRNVNDGGLDLNPAVSADEKSLVFVRQTGPTNNDYDLFFTWRGDPDADFAPPQPLNDLNSPAAELTPFLTLNGAELWFSSRRQDGGASQIFRACASGGTFIDAEPMASPDVTSTRQEGPVLSADGKILFYSGNGQGAQDNYDIWEARRETTNAPFKVRRRVNELSGGALDYPSWLSPDGCRLYVHSLFNHFGEIRMAVRQR